MKWCLLVLIGVLTGFLSSCALVRITPINTETPEPTFTVTPQPTAPPATPTATIVWFPATATPRPLNTPTPFPTAEFLMDKGDVILTEDFSDESRWQTYRSRGGNAVVSNNELTLAIQDSANTIVSYGQLPRYADYYLSVDVSLSICSYYRDGYGLTFRVKDSDNLYRWVFNCRGETRLEKVFQGKTYRLTEWAANGAIRLSAPQKFNLAVAVDGTRIRLYAGKQLVTELNDGSVSDGGYGFFAYSEGYAPVTVSFSRLEIREIP